MPFLSAQWAVRTTAQRENGRWDTRKGPALRVLMLQTPLVSQSYKRQTFTLPLHLRNMFYVVFNRGLLSYWSQSACQSCSMQTQMRERKKSMWIPGCSAFSKLLDYLFSPLSFKLPCVLTLNQGYVAMAALPVVGSYVSQQRNQMQLLSRSDGLGSAQSTVPNAVMSEARSQ